MNIKFVPVDTIKQAEEIAMLAENIWYDHYIEILSVKQIAYMIEKFQSVNAIRKQIECDYQYFLFEYDNSFVGYMSIMIDDNSLFLSKIYIKKQFRGMGIASKALNLLCEICNNKNLKSIWLTVNKNNTASIAAYAALGFSTERSQTTDIGGGFVMDDFVMRKQIL